jgi:hypothetical protein
MSAQSTDGFPQMPDAEAHERDRANGRRGAFQGPPGRVSACGKHDRSKSNESANVTMVGVGATRRDRVVCVRHDCGTGRDGRQGRSRGDSSMPSTHDLPTDRRSSVLQPTRMQFIGLWLDAPDPILIARSEQRQFDASDADADVIRRQRAGGTGQIAWQTIDASIHLKTVLRRTMLTLRNRLSSGVIRFESHATKIESPQSHPRMESLR